MQSYIFHKAIVSPLSGIEWYSLLGDDDNDGYGFLNNQYRSNLFPLQIIWIFIEKIDFNFLRTRFSPIHRYL